MSHSTYFNLSSHPTIFTGQIENNMKVNQDIYAMRNNWDDTERTEELHAPFPTEIQKLQSDVKEIKRSLDLLRKMMRGHRRDIDQPENGDWQLSKFEAEQEELFKEIYRQIEAHGQLINRLGILGKSQSELLDRRDEPRRTNELGTQISELNPVNLLDDESSSSRLENLQTLPKKNLDDNTDHTVSRGSNENVEILANSADFNFYEETEEQAEMGNHKEIPEEKDLYHVLNNEINQDYESQKDTILHDNDSHTDTIYSHIGHDEESSSDESSSHLDDKQYGSTLKKHDISNIIATLPVNYPVSTVFVEGTKISVTHFIEYDKDENQAYFGNDDSLVSFNCNKIDGIVFE